MALGLVLTAAAAIAQQPTARIISPEVSADRRVTFRVLAPQAREIALTGEFMQGSKPLEKDANGLWTLTIGPLEPEIYHYNLMIDGVRTIDPNNPDVKTGSTPSTISSILEVPGNTPAFYDPQTAEHGDVRSLRYRSRSLGTERRLTVYTPPDYDRNMQGRYPVLYLLHGANADETAWHRLGRVNLILDNLRPNGRVKPFIVVMPFGYGVPPNTQAQPGENTAKFGRDLIEDVIPFIESRYRTIADRDHRALVGLSMGGGEALTIGLNHLELFSHVGGFSAAVGQAATFPKTYATLVADGKASNQKLRLLWVGCGNEDGLFDASKSFSEFLTQLQIRHTFHESTGAHTWMVWRRYLNEIAPLLFQSGQ
jgi:enterochelin esterase-like enzyme